jgi:hypothetical protein
LQQKLDEGFKASSWCSFHCSSSLHHHSAVVTREFDSREPEFFVFDVEDN